MSNGKMELEIIWTLLQVSNRWNQSSMGTDTQRGGTTRVMALNFYKTGGSGEGTSAHRTLAGIISILKRTFGKSFSEKS